MKKALSLIFLICLFASANAQWSTNGNNIYNTNTGNVGIGTSSPTALLQVNGPLNGSPSLTFGVPGTTGNLSVPVGSTTGGYNIDFNTYRDIVPNQIGARIRAERTNIYQPNNALVQSMDLVFFTSWGYDQTYLTEKLRIAASGNVGIGTASPSNNLQIGTQTPVATSNPLTLSLGATLSNTAGFSPKLKLFDDGTNFYGFGISSNQIDVIVPAGGNFAWYQGGIQKMILNGAGDVGIGTNNIPPGYLLAINGSAMATSVTVQSYATWPDYVFKPKYHLPTLAEVKSFIDQNQHLPEMPSAEKIEKDGINLGDMDKMLVKKVEELTLYLIEKDKQLKTQQAEIDQLKQNAEAEKEKQSKELDLLKQQVQLMIKTANRN